MCKQQNINEYQGTAVSAAQPLANIGAVFQAWVQASEIIGDMNAPEAARVFAQDRMAQLWDAATDLRVNGAHDVAALYIMAHRTVSVDPDTFMEAAHCLTYAANQEAEMTRLYGVWLKLYAACDTLDMSDETLMGVGAIACDIEGQIAAIPATTARMLAIKVDVGRHHVKESPLAQSLAADLAALTGNQTRPA